MSMFSIDSKKSLPSSSFLKRAKANPFKPPLRKLSIRRTNSQQQLKKAVQDNLYLITAIQAERSQKTVLQNMLVENKQCDLSKEMLHDMFERMYQHCKQLVKKNPFKKQVDCTTQTPCQLSDLTAIRPLPHNFKSKQSIQDELVQIVGQASAGREVDTLKLKIFQLETQISKMEAEKSSKRSSLSAIHRFNISLTAQHKSHKFVLEQQFSTFLQSSSNKRLSHCSTPAIKVLPQQALLCVSKSVQTRNQHRNNPWLSYFPQFNLTLTSGSSIKLVSRLEVEKQRLEELLKQTNDQFEIVSRRLVETLAREAQLLEQMELTKSREVALHSEIIRLSRNEESKPCLALPKQNNSIKNPHLKRLAMAYSINSTVLPIRKQSDRVLRAISQAHDKRYKPQPQPIIPIVHQYHPQHTTTTQQGDLTWMVDRLLKQNQKLAELT